MTDRILLMLVLAIAIVAMIVAMLAFGQARIANQRARRAHSFFLMRQIMHSLKESIRLNHLTREKVAVQTKRLEVIEEGGFKRTVRVKDDSLADKKVGLKQCPVLSDEQLEWEVFSPKVNRLRQQILNIELVPILEYTQSPQYQQGQQALAQMMKLMERDIKKMRNLPA